MQRGHSPYGSFCLDIQCKFKICIFRVFFPLWTNEVPALLLLNRLTPSSYLDDNCRAIKTTFYLVLVCLIFVSLATPGNNAKLRQENKTKQLDLLLTVLQYLAFTGLIGMGSKFMSLNSFYPRLVQAIGEQSPAFPKAWKATSSAYELAADTQKFLGCTVHSHATADTTSPTAYIFSNFCLW